MLRLSVVIPVLNEEAVLREALPAMECLRTGGHEVIVVDGGSTDGSRRVAARFADRLLSTAPGRARQMNAGAAIARGDVLIFLHADTRLPNGADTLIAAAFTPPEPVWGRFDVRLSGSQFALRIIESLMNLRSRWSGIATGDQGIFVRRSVFEAVEGFPEIALMEDIALSRRLRARRAPVCLRKRVVTSSRRWETRGLVRTVLLMWKLRAAYFLGADPDRLARVYDRT